MSDGPKSKPEELRLITLDPEEFNSVVHRVHELLSGRVDKAKASKDAKPTRRREGKHIEAAKDLFVFVHMMELIEHMSSEIADLRDTLTAVGVHEEGDEIPEMFAAKKTPFLN